MEAGNMVMKFKMSLFIVLGGYISSLISYFIWYFTKWGYSLYGSNVTATNIDLTVIVICITVLYFFLFLLISCIESFQKFWPSFSLVLTITLLTFLFIPFAYYGGYYENPGERLNLKQDEIDKIFKLRQKDKSDLFESADLSSDVIDIETRRKEERMSQKKLLASKKEKIQKQLEENKENIQVQANYRKEIEAGLNKKVAEIKVNPEEGNTDSDKTNQEIIFKVQILSSDNRLSADFPRFKNLRDVWEYKDGDLYKYTVGNTKDLKSASVLKSELREMGFGGAFVVSFKNGKRIPVREALKFMSQ